MKKVHSRKSRLISAGGGGILVAFTCLVMGVGKYALLSGWDAAALILSGLIWFDLHGHSATSTERAAKSDDMRAPIMDGIILGACLASIVAVGYLLLSSKNGNLAVIGFGLASIVISWATVHALYSLRYAAEYYTGSQAIDFNDSQAPVFSDFVYLAYTIGMTYQVSDTSFKSSAMRRLALGQALLSFVFGTAIIATTINLIAGLASSQ